MDVQEYRLDLRVDFHALTFEGFLTINLTPDGAEVLLHSNGLSIRSARATGRELTVEPRPETQEVALGGVPPGTTQIEVEYSGKVLTDGLVGLYRTRYDPGYALTTQFAATEARRLLPCVDRPDRKAVFQVSTTVDPELEVIFNTPPEQVTVANGVKTVRFAPTPRMSTYLLYLGIGRFDALRGKTGRVDLAVWTPPGRAAAGEWALQLASQILPEYERYYGIPYPLPKLDLVAVPEFWAGAMENWGAIAFSEMSLLADRTTSTLFRRMIAETVAHEIAHMWFGNLVTMAWWNDVWLNESFATFMSYRMIDRVRPEFESWNDFLPRWSAPAFFGDSLGHTHPIFVDVEKPEEINQIFDEISYGKGASVLRMLEHYLGEEPFRRGVNLYLTKFQYANARTEDLWRSLEEASEQPVHRIMDAWVHQPGVPLLYVHVGDGRFSVEQKRFLLSGHHLEQAWPIPVVGRWDGVEHRILVDHVRTELALTGEEPPILNVGAHGFYRVLYDRGTYDRILKLFPRLSALDRWAIVHDLAPFVLSGDLSLDLFFRFVEFGRFSTEQVVVQQFGRALTTLHIPLYDYPEFLASYRRFLQTQTERLGLTPRPDEPEIDRMLREDLLLQRVWVDPEFAQSLAVRYPEYDTIDADLRTAVLTSYARVEGPRAVEPLLTRLRTTAAEAETLRLVQALTAFQDPELVRRVFDLADRREILLSMIPYVVLGATRNPAARTVAWEWLLKNVDVFASSFRGSGWASRLLEVVLPRLGLGREHEAEEFFRTHKVVEGDRGVEKGLEVLRIFRALRERHERRSPS